MVDYVVGQLLQKTDKQRQRNFLLGISLTANLGLLGFFKYYNFFIDSFIEAGAQVGLTFHKSSLNIILPVGISFYTFQTLSYAIDVYRRQLSTTKDLISFLAFVSFFPQLVAGPIERASNLLPQFERKRFFDTEKAKDGLRQILWGLIKKVVIADTLAVQVDLIFDTATYTSTPGITLIIGAILFAFQIYCDFSGYSDIGIGTARLFGFSLMRNFAYPFFSRNIGEFWQRWHISLSTWFRDYIFIPLGGSKVSKAKQIRNILATFVLSGLWHGANWTYIIWGLLNGLYYLPQMLSKNRRKYLEIVAANQNLPSKKELFQMVLTFSLAVFALIFFRSDNLRRSFSFISNIAYNLMLKPEIFLTWLQSIPLLFIMVLTAIEWVQRRKQHVLQIENLPGYSRWTIYIISIAVFVYLGQFNSDQQFIYFQF
jgi:D-alanyl-lipoteichoic acid acyltransferase DltB (MBOAT superfamily)